MTGKEFIALRRLSTRDNTTLADVGQTCERVPVASLPALYASGKIQPIDTHVPERAETVAKLRKGKA